MHTSPTTMRKSSIPRTFRQIRTHTRMETVIQVNVSRIIAAYRSATPSPATATVELIVELRGVAQ